jgi:hypothetical protein
VLHTAITTLALLPAALCLGVAIWGWPQQRPPTRRRSLLLRGGAVAVAFASLVAAARVARPECVPRPPAVVPNAVEATVYLTLADNTGRPFPEGLWDQALALLVTPFGGGDRRRPARGVLGRRRRPTRPRAGAAGGGQLRPGAVE